MKENEVSAEEMTEQETSDFKDAFSKADALEEEGSLEDGQETAEEETYADGPKEEEEPEEDIQKPQTILVNGREYTQEEIAQKLSEPTQRYGVLERLAGEAGMDLEEYLENVDERYMASQMESRAAQLMDQGLDESFARHVARAEVENAKFKAGIELSQRAQEQERETQEQLESRMRSEIAEFDRVYPDIREIPPEVIDDIAKTGHSPVMAYQNYLLRRQEAELKALKQAKRNRETLPGAAKGTAGGKNDEFGEAFWAAMRD